jgi:hypothetical protein
VLIFFADVVPLAGSQAVIRQSLRPMKSAKLNKVILQGFSWSLLINDFILLMLTPLPLLTTLNSFSPKNALNAPFVFFSNLLMAKILSSSRTLLAYSEQTCFSDSVKMGKSQGVLEFLPSFKHLSKALLILIQLLLGVLACISFFGSQTGKLFPQVFSFLAASGSPGGFTLAKRMNFHVESNIIPVVVATLGVVVAY